MPRFSANISMMFSEVDFLDRFAAAKKAGFDAVEFLFPYEYKPEEIAGRVKDNALEVSLYNLPSGDWDGGDRGMTALADRSEEFRGSVSKALEYVEATGVKRMHAMAGITGLLSLDEARSTYVQNLSYAAELLADHGLDLLIEPLNARDAPGYFLSSTRQAVDIIAEVAAPNLKLQFDVYHHQITHGDVTRSLEEHMPVIGHIQIAGVPERHEPDVGELNYPAIFKWIDELGYSGWIGCEYRPQSETVQGLKWLGDLKARQGQQSAHPDAGSCYGTQRRTS